MNPRNMQTNNRIIEFEVAQQMQNQQQQEPYILFGSPPSFPYPSTTSGSINNLDGTSLYRLPQYSHQMHPIINPELGTFYNPYLFPGSGTRMMYSIDQLPSSANFGPTSSHFNGYGVNNFPPNIFRSSSKRNGSSEQYFNSPPPMNVGHFDPGVAILDPGFHFPEFGGNYIGQSFRTPTSTWCERQPISPYIDDAVPQPPGIRIFRSNRRPHGNHRHHNLPQLRLLEEEGVAILSSSAVDHHRDMRLDIDYMSYEELLALSERIGNVKTGLCEDTITAKLKTRVYRSSMASIDLEELPCSDDKNDSCVICQDEYEENDKIGSLVCGHEYHVKCLKKWLPVKNTCPICKSTALNEEQKKS